MNWNLSTRFTKDIWKTPPIKTLEGRLQAQILDYKIGRKEGTLEVFLFDDDIKERTYRVLSIEVPYRSLIDAQRDAEAVLSYAERYPVLGFPGLRIERV